MNDVVIYELNKIKRILIGTPEEELMPIENLNNHPLPISSVE
jgi:hypothetical protein